MLKDGLMNGAAVLGVPVKATIKEVYVYIVPDDNLLLFTHLMEVEQSVLICKMKIPSGLFEHLLFCKTQDVSTLLFAT